MNIVVLIGRLTADPELKTTQSGINYCRFSIAVDRPAKAGEEKKADFLNCVAWRGTAEFICKYFTKGQMIAVQGNIQTGSYTNNDGAKVNTVDILINQANFCGSKNANTNSESAAIAPPEAPKGKSKATSRASDAVKSDPLLGNDLPF